MIHHLRAAGVSLVIDARGPGLPLILHWGRALGETTEADLEALADAAAPSIPRSSVDIPLRVSLAPAVSDGWSGRPALSLDREPVFALVGVDATPASLTISATDADAQLALTTQVELTEHGILRIRHTVHNRGDDLRVGAASVIVPVPDRAREVLDFSGQWSHERRPQRSTPGLGVWLRESRHGRTGHENGYLLVAGTPGFGFGEGEVWSAHVAWSGDGALWFERSSLGPTVIGGGELLNGGEVVLGDGQSYTSPWLVLTYSEHGLDGISDRLHPWVRSWSRHSGPRPVILNTWEAVYFDQSLAGLEPLIVAAERVGVERFVLDDGWFRGRTDDKRALGDWYVDRRKWPDGLGPLVERVRRAGMEFGLWVEPEMVNRDSDVAREHPDWVLQPAAAPAWRSQFNLDLANPDAFDYLFERLDALLTEYPIAYLKWDCNRDLLLPDAHRPAAALYRLLDDLRAAHPSVEVESCASGGARIDLGILPRVDRVWTSDTNDPLERQTIQRYTGLIVPPEYVGAHLGPTRSHTTARVSTLSFRMATALFGWAGIEWDLGEASGTELDDIAEWIALYKRERRLLHSGRVVRGDTSEPAQVVHGVVAQDGSRAIFSYALIATSAAALTPPVRLPGLDPERRYRVRPIRVGEAAIIDDEPPVWWSTGSISMSGELLGQVGIPMPLLAPENALVLEVEATRD